MINRKQSFATTALLVFILLCIQVSSSAKIPSDLSKADIIPRPVSIAATGGSFSLKSGTDIYIRDMPQHFFMLEE